MLKTISCLTFVAATFTGFIGMSPMAYGANKKLTEADACSMAKAEVSNKQGGKNKVELTILNCAKFLMFDQGMANIQVLYDSSYFNDYMKTRYETKNLTDTCSFVQTGQGWKISRCR